MALKLIATQPPPAIPTNQWGIKNLSTPSAIFLISASLIILSAIIYLYIPKKKQYLARFKSNSQIPCHHCQYFNVSPYLKCAIHPVTVMTNQAVDCQNYDPHIKEQRMAMLQRVLLVIQKKIF